jgi:PPOX class probable F420-dependent enzyme
VPINLDEARGFLREHHHGVLATRGADGRIQQSPVLVNIDGEGWAIISSRETAYKVRNLRRDPWAQACVFTDRFFGRWLFIEGRAEVLSLPEAMDPLIDYYKRFPDENPDWDDYRARMERERRVPIRIDSSRAPVPIVKADTRPASTPLCARERALAHDRFCPSAGARRATASATPRSLGSPAPGERFATVAIARSCTAADPRNH